MGCDLVRAQHDADRVQSCCQSAGSCVSGVEKQQFLRRHDPKNISSCDHQDGASPELSWSAPPEHTQSFALIVFDKDSPFGFKFTHWVFHDIPSDKRELPENTPKQEQLPDGSRQGHNDYDRIGYVGPCPPRGTHHYIFTLYALDINLNLPPSASKKQVVKAMNGHVLASGELVGRFQH